MAMPSRWAASQTVVPAGTATARPSMVRWTSGGAGASGSTGASRNATAGRCRTIVPRSLLGGHPDYHLEAEVLLDGPVERLPVADPQGIQRRVGGELRRG